MLPRQLISRRARDERLPRFAERDGSSAGACGAGFTEMIAIVGPAVCGLLAQGTT